MKVEGQRILISPNRHASQRTKNRIREHGANGFILEKVWNYSSETDTHTVETHIHRLRKKILDKFSDSNFIKNNNKGYFI